MTNTESPSDGPRLVFPKGVTTKQARRLADIGDALAPIGATMLVDASLYELSPLCPCCEQPLEAGHCYACKPVFGYGEGFRCDKCSAAEDEAEFKRQAKKAGLGDV